MMDKLPIYKGEYGMWMAYSRRHASGDIHLVATHTLIIKIVEIVRDLGRNQAEIGFLPLGMDLDLAVQKWEETEN